MRRICLALCLLAIVTPLSVSAQILVVTRGGYYLLNMDGSGKPSLTPIQQVVTLDGGPTTPPPLPAPTNTLRGKSKSLALATGDSTGILALSSVYEIVADKIANGEIATDRAFAATVQLTDAVLGALGTTAKWSTWRSDISNELLAMQQAGQLGTKAQYAAAFKDISLGLNDASKASGILDKIDWVKLFELIKLILSLLSSFK